MLEVTKPIEIVYFGKNIKGELKNEMGYLGIKLAAPDALTFYKNKKSIKFEEIEQDDISNDEYQLVFSIDKRDQEGLKEVIKNNLKLLDSADMNNAKNIEKLAEKMAEKGYGERGVITQILDNSASESLSAADIGKAVIVVDHNSEDIAKVIKHKFIVASIDKGSIRIVDERNKGFKAEGKLIFYVEENHVDLFKQGIEEIKKTYIENAANSGSPVDENSLVDLGNEIIQYLKGFYEESSSKPLSLTKYNSIPLAQNVYERGNNKQEVILGPATLARIEPKVKTTDSASVHSADSGVSSQSETSTDVNRESEPKGLYPAINLKIEAAITAVNRLKSWIANKSGLSDTAARLNISLDKIVKNLNASSSAEADINACESLKSVANTLKSYFKSRVNQLDLHPKYATKKSVSQWIEDCFIGITKGEEGFKTVNNVVNLIISTDQYLKEYKISHDAFKNKYDAFLEHQEKLKVLMATLAIDPQLTTARKELEAVMASWNKELENFNPVCEDRSFQSQAVLSEKVAEFKTLFEQKYCALEMANHAILQEKLNKDVQILKVSAEKLQVKPGSVLAKEKGQLVNNITTLLTSISKPTPANGNINDFQAQYHSLKNGVASLAQGLTRKQRVTNLFTKHVVDAVSDIHVKAEKLELGNTAAKNKATKLFEIKKQVLAIKDKIASSNDETVKQAIASAKATIAQSRDDISAYRSQWGSGFFFGTLLRMNLESRVSSTRLINALDSQLDNFASQFEASKQAGLR